MIGLTTLNILRTSRAILMSFFALLILQDVRCLFWGAMYFDCFNRLLPVKKLFQKIDCIVKSNPLPTPKLRSHPFHPLSHIRQKSAMNILQENLMK